MATARIRLDQPSHSSTPTGTANKSRDDIELNKSIQLVNTDDAGVTFWNWELISQPDRSSPISISNPLAASPTFTPVVAGTYLIQLTVNEGRKGQVQRLIAAIRDSVGRRIPGTQEKAEANWDSTITSSANTTGWAEDANRFLEPKTEEPSSDPDVGLKSQTIARQITTVNPTLDVTVFTVDPATDGVYVLHFQLALALDGGAGTVTTRDFRAVVSVVAGTPTLVQVALFAALSSGGPPFALDSIQLSGNNVQIRITDFGARNANLLGFFLVQRIDETVTP